MDATKRATPDAIEVFVNGEAQPVASSCKVADLLVLLGLTGRRVAVAINREVVPRSSFGVQPLAPGDRVEILQAVGGG